MINLILFGPPGSGKGTQAEKLVNKYDLLHISTGDLFRFNLKNSTPLGLEARKYIDKGELVPDTVTISMLRTKVEENPNVKGYIFDGFPRTIPQCEALDALLAERKDEVSKLVLLDVPEEELVGRLLERGKSSGRADDANDDVIRKRIKVYENETSPVFDYYFISSKSVKVWGVGELEMIFQRLSLEVDVIEF
ncbi:MAG: adenylate kinase [Paraglaciecola sp.]|jgi:adenylate kinase